MIVKQALSLIAAIAAMAAAAAVCIVAAAYALYAFIRLYLEPAAAAAAIAVGFAVLAVVLALVAYGKVKPKRVKPEDQSVSTRLIELAREKPIIAAGAAVAAGLVLLRNPGVVGAIVTAAMSNRGKDADRRDRERRR